MKLENVFLAMLISVLLTACIRSNESDPQFSVTSSEPGDTITITYKDNISIIDINSPSGIGSARVDFVSGPFPQKIIARLHLKGLEEFRLLYADTVIIASASSGSAFNNDNQRILLSGTEEPILPGQPLWMEIRIVSDQTAQNIPLDEGYFEVTFPQEFMENAGNSFEIQWVDFFRP